MPPLPFPPSPPLENEVQGLQVLTWLLPLTRDGLVVEGYLSGGACPRMLEARVLCKPHRQPAQQDTTEGQRQQGYPFLRVKARCTRGDQLCDDSLVFVIPDPAENAAAGLTSIPPCRTRKTRTL